MEGAPGTHCLHICKVPLETCTLACYTKTTLHCRVMLPMKHTWGQNYYHFECKSLHCLVTLTLICLLTFQPDKCMPSTVLCGKDDEKPLSYFLVRIFNHLSVFRISYDICTFEVGWLPETKLILHKFVMTNKKWGVCTCTVCTRAVLGDLSKRQA